MTAPTPLAGTPTAAGVPVLAIGTEIQMSDMKATPAFTTIAMVRSINGPSFKTTTKDVTAHDSPGRAIQRLATLLDPGDMKFKINLNPVDPTHSTTTGIMGNWLNLAMVDYKFILPTNPTTIWDLKSTVTDMGVTAAIDDVLLADITLTNFILPNFAGTLLTTAAAAPATKTNGAPAPAAPAAV